MPLVGTNFYGIQAQNTGWDDAERYNASSRDAAIRDLQNRLLAKRGQDNALQMNRDNLDFARWSEGQQDARFTRGLEAQRGMAQDAQNFQRSMASDQRAYEADAWKTREQPFQQAQLADIARRQKRDEDLDARERVRMQRADAARAFIATPEGQARLKSEGVAALAPYIDDPAAIAQLFVQDYNRKQSATDARLADTVRQVQTLRQQGRTQEADALAATVPAERRAEVPAVDPTAQPRTIAEATATDARARGILAAAVQRVQRDMRQAKTEASEGIAGLWTDTNDVTTGQRLRTLAKREAQAIAKAANLDPLEVEQELVNEMTRVASTNVWSWIKGTDQSDIVRGLSGEVDQ